MVCRLLSGCARDLSDWESDFRVSFGFGEPGDGQESSSCRSSTRDPRCGFAGNPTLFLSDCFILLVLGAVLLFPRGRPRPNPSCQPNCALPPPYSYRQNYPAPHRTIQTKTFASLPGSTSEPGTLHFSKWVVCSFWARFCRYTWVHFWRRVGTGHREGCGPIWQVWRRRGCQEIYLWRVGVRACG